MELTPNSLHEFWIVDRHGTNFKGNHWSPHHRHWHRMRLGEDLAQAISGALASD
jgi:frataxin-like iron-binding protein CyaY